MGAKMLAYHKVAHYQKQYVVNVAVPSFPFFFSQKPTQPKPEPKAKKAAKVRETLVLIDLVPPSRRHCQYSACFLTTTERKGCE